MSVVDATRYHDDDYEFVDRMVVAKNATTTQHDVIEEKADTELK